MAFFIRFCSFESDLGWPLLDNVIYKRGRMSHYAMIREGNLLEIKKVECLKIEFLIMNQTYREKIVFLHVRRSPKQI